MSDYIEYAEMSEIPISSCEINLKPAKGGVREKVLKKANHQLENTVIEKKKRKKSIFSIFKRKTKSTSNNTPREKVRREKDGQANGFDIVSAQVIMIFALIVAILLTNIFWEDSAMNRMIKNVFNKNESIVRDYDYFQAVAPSESVSVDNGVISVLNKGSVYSPVAGKINKIEKLSDGSFSVTVTHSSTFKSVISGLEYCYFDTGVEVFSTTPIGYSLENITKVEMYDQDVLLTDYSIENGLIKWN